MNNRKTLIDEIERIEKVDGIKLMYDDFVRLHLKSGNTIDLMSECVRNYQEGDEIEYLADNKGNLIYKEQGIPEYLQNKSIVERRDSVKIC